MENNDLYFKVAKAASLYSTCNKRRYGAAIVAPDGSIKSVGFNHSPEPPARTCKAMHFCTREQNSYSKGQNYEHCQSIHAEMHAIMEAGLSNIEGCTLYLYCFDEELQQEVKPEPCFMCKRLIKEAKLEVKLNG